MNSLYAVCPFLPRAASRLPPEYRDPNAIDDSLLSSASQRLRQILAKKADFTVLDEKTEVLHFVLFRIFLSILNRDYYYDVLGMYYAERTKRLADPDAVLSEVGLGDVVSLHDYMMYRHVYPETKVYHLPVSGGYVYLPEHLGPLMAANVAYTLSVKGLPLDVGDLPQRYKEYAQRAIPPVRVKTSSSKGYSHIEAILSASGIPDGRKRIIFYWLAPYLTTVQGKSPEEAVDIINQWLQRQGGSRIPPSFVVDQVRLAHRKGIRPWGVSKVKSNDPELYRLLRDMGVLE